MKIIHIFRKLIAALENPKIPFGNYILTFVFIMTLRNFLEMFSDNEEISFELFAHYSLSYTCLAMALMVLFYFATREPIHNIARMILVSFMVLVLAPTLDLIISLGKGYNMSYMLPGIHENLLYRFFTFFGPFDKFGVSPGIRIEIALVLVASGIYFYIKTENILRSIFFSFLTYCLFFLYGIMPYAARFFLNVCGLEYTYSALLMRNVYLLLILILVAILYALYRRNYFIEILKDLRYLRILHYIVMFVFGIVLAREAFVLTEETLFYLIFTSASIVFAGLFSLITNNLIDYDIDKISNTSRPSVSKSIPTGHYMKLAWIAFIMAIIYSLAVSFTTMFLILLSIAVYYFYSMPPLRLKRVLFFSKMLIALNSLVLLIAGFLFMGGKLQVPMELMLFILIGFTAVINFIDIKDFEGDKQAGIKTLPTIMGLKKSKLLIALFFAIIYPCSYFILKEKILLFPAIITGCILFFLIIRKKYDERPVFLVYLSSIILLILYLINFPKP